MAHKHKKSQGKGYVTHRSRGRFTLVSPQNLQLPSTKALLSGDRELPKVPHGRRHDRLLCPACKMRKSAAKFRRGVCAPCAKRRAKQDRLI